MLCILAAILLIVPQFSPVALSDTIEKTIEIQTHFYNNHNVETISTILPVHEAEEIKDILLELNRAIEQRNEEAIRNYETLLQKKGILREKPRTHFSQDCIPRVQTRFQNLFSNLLNENISNSMCYVNVVGSGFMYFTIGIILGILMVFLLSIFGEDILTLLLPLYIGVALVTHIIPFRPFLPIGIIAMDNGTITTVGTQGTQNMELHNQSAQVILTGFAGLTINIPFGEQEGFLYVSGFALAIKAGMD